MHSLVCVIMIDWSVFGGGGDTMDDPQPQDSQVIVHPGLPKERERLPNGLVVPQQLQLMNRSKKLRAAERKLSKTENRLAEKMKEVDVENQLEIRKLGRNVHKQL